MQNDRLYKVVAWQGTPIRRGAALHPRGEPPCRTAAAGHCKRAEHFRASYRNQIVKHFGQWRALSMHPPARWRARNLAVGCCATSAGPMPKASAAAAAASESPPAAKKSEPGSRREKLEADVGKVEAEDRCRAAVKAASTRASQPPPPSALSASADRCAAEMDNRQT